MTSLRHWLTVSKPLSRLLTCCERLFEERKLQSNYHAYNGPSSITELFKPPLETFIYWINISSLYITNFFGLPLKCKNEYPVLPLGEETAVQAVVGSIIWAFRRLKKPRCREMSASGYALHSVCPQISFSFPSFLHISNY